MASFSLTKGSEPYLIVRQKTYTISHQEEFNLQREDPQLKLLFEQIIGARTYH